MTIEVGHRCATAGFERGGNWGHSHRLPAVQHIVSVFFILDVRDVPSFWLFPSIPLVPFVCTLGPAGPTGEPGRPAMQAVPRVVMVGVGHAADYAGWRILMAKDGAAQCWATKSSKGTRA